LHSYEDIPVLLGIESAPAGSASQRQRAGDVFRHNPHLRQGRSLHYASAIGTDARFAEIVVDQARAFDADPRSLTENFCARVSRLKDPATIKLLQELGAFISPGRKVLPT
jgi:sirohydrochlorin cobaltochelatase